MDFLFDTHILLWTITGSEKLSPEVLEVLNNPKNNIYYSVASMWEVSIKNQLNKLPISATLFMHYCEQSGFKKLPIDDRHVLSLETLELAEENINHKDPFDRMLLSQAKTNGMILITHDKKFSSYNESCIKLV